MNYWDSVLAMLTGALPVMAVLTILMPIPFIIAEQLRPAITRPRWQAYGLNMAISMITVVLSAPIGIAAGMAATAAQAVLGWQPLVIPFDSIEGIAGVGPLLKGALLMIAPLILHDLWFYWSHRLEHRVPVLWAFHSLHHSDRELNCTTWARDHFLQSGWRSFISVFTLGMIVRLDYMEAGAAAMLGQVAFMLLSMFYHSAIRVELPWLDRIVVTPQVHRIHHCVDRANHDSNFADLFPVMDILFGTYLQPVRGDFPATGLGDEQINPRDPVSAQLVPVWRGIKALAGAAASK